MKVTGPSGSIGPASQRILTIAFPKPTAIRPKHIINQGLDKLDVALSGSRSEGGACKRMTLCVQDARCQ